jgi:MFS superfamily sulfate permease-like transporter
MLALIVGLIEIGLGLGKLGFVADLLSSEVQVGYMNGLGITIIVGQLPKLFGFSTDADTFGGEIRAFLGSLDQTVAGALLIGLAVLATLLVLPRITTRIPAVLIAVVVQARCQRFWASRRTVSRPWAFCRAGSRRPRSRGPLFKTPARSPSPPWASRSCR